MPKKKIADSAINGYFAPVGQGAVNDRVTSRASAQPQQSTTSKHSVGFPFLIARRKYSRLTDVIHLPSREHNHQQSLVVSTHHPNSPRQRVHAERQSKSDAWPTSRDTTLKGFTFALETNHCITSSSTFLRTLKHNRMASPPVSKLSMSLTSSQNLNVLKLSIWQWRLLEACC